MREMTPGGWAFLIGSWAAVLLLTIYCVARILTVRPPSQDDEEDAG